MKVRLAHYSFTSDRNGKRRFWVHVEQWGLCAYVWWRSYHWYEMRFPVNFRFYRWILRTFPGDMDRGMSWSRDRRLRDRMHAWTVHQDLHCYELSVGGRYLTHTEITEEQAVAMGLRQEHLCD